MNYKGACLLVFLAVLTLPATAIAAVPQTINYQGYLTDSGGNPVNSTVSMTFRIYSVPSGGTALWTQTLSSVPVSNGVYNVVLGSTSPVNLLFNEQYYLGVQAGTDGEMTPRQQLTGVPYAMRAKEADNADTLDGVHAGALQNRVTGICATGNSIRAINPDGTVTCQTDNGITA